MVIKILTGLEKTIPEPKADLNKETECLEKEPIRDEEFTDKIKKYTEGNEPPTKGCSRMD